MRRINSCHLLCNSTINFCIADRRLREFWIIFSRKSFFREESLRVIFSIFLEKPLTKQDRPVTSSAELVRRLTQQANLNSLGRPKVQLRSAHVKYGA